MAARTLADGDQHRSGAAARVGRLSLGRRRSALRRDRDQLYRPADARRAQADRSPTELRWSEIDYANIVFWFQTAYAIGYLGFGRIVDLIGARLGYAAAFLIWTLAHIAHGGVHSVTQFAAVRFGLGIGESRQFPGRDQGGHRMVSGEASAPSRSACSTPAPISARSSRPLVVPWLTVAYGWRTAFVVTGLASLVWLVAWLAIYRRPREHKRVGAAELAHIRQDPADPVGAGARGALIAVRRETWAFALGKFCIDPIWWFFLFWLPGLSRRALPSRHQAVRPAAGRASTCSPTSARSSAAGCPRA